MKKLLGVLLMAGALGGCTHHKLTEENGYYKDYTEITNYQRLYIEEPVLEINIDSEDNDTSVLDLEVLKEALTKGLGAKGVSVSYSENAPYKMVIHRVGRDEISSASSDSAISGARAGSGAGLGGMIIGSVVGLAVGSTQDNRLWLVDLSLYKEEKEHTRYTRFIPSASQSFYPNQVAGEAVAEFFELKQ